jgi:putative DNA primase/helicase
MTAKAYERFGAGHIRPAADMAESRKRVRGFWHRCDAAAGTPAEAYLSRRGIGWLAGHEHVRFRADCPHPSGCRLPAMIWLVLDGTGDICAVHRTFLETSGVKAAIVPNKATLGSFAGGAIRVHPACPEMVVGEGVETTASAAAILQLPGWSAIACGNLGSNVRLPPLVQAVVIAADHDAAGQRAANTAARRWRAEGRTVRIAIPEGRGQDFNDLLRQRLLTEARRG